MKIASLLLLMANCSNNEKVPAVSAFDRYNLNFETIENEMPTGWQANGHEAYKFSIDSIIVKNGKYSAAIENKDESARFGLLGLIIPDNFEGKRSRCQRM